MRRGDHAAVFDGLRRLAFEAITDFPDGHGVPSNSLVDQGIGQLVDTLQSFSATRRFSARSMASRHGRPRFLPPGLPDMPLTRLAGRQDAAIEEERRCFPLASFGEPLSAPPLALRLATRKAEPVTLGVDHSGRRGQNFSDHIDRSTAVPHLSHLGVARLALCAALAWTPRVFNAMDEVFGLSLDSRRRDVREGRDVRATREQRPTE